MSDPSPESVVLVPIRSFDDGKSRLAGALDAGERRRLTMQMASRVIAAARELPVRVVTDDPEVGEWAAASGVEAWAVDRRGLNPTVTAAVVLAEAAGFSRVIVAHADLPAARDLGVVDGPGVRIAPDRARDGSNVVCIPTDAGFVFAYGPGSFARHRAEAERLGLPFTVVDDDSLAWDVDDPSDLPTDWID